MRIRYKVALVGGIPITIAAAIAVAALLLLLQGERAREGARLAEAAYSDLVELTAARDEYIRVRSDERERQAERILQGAKRARERLQALALSSRDPAQTSAAARTEEALQRYRDQMSELRGVTERNDHLVSEMN